MRILFSIIIALIFCSCKTKDSKAIELITINNSNLNLKEIKKIDCFEVLQSYNFTNEDIRITKVNIVNIINDNSYAKLTLKNIDESSLLYNIEVYRVNNSDTLRVANFGGRKISKVESISSIKETLCKFLNK